MPEVSNAAARLVYQLKHEVRLPILVALEERPRTKSDVAREIGKEYQAVRFAMDFLAEAGLVEVVSETRTSSSVMSKVYGTPYSGWAELAALLDKIATSRDEAT